MGDNRRYKRYTIEESDVEGSMLFASEVKIIDISGSGISIKLDRRLNLGNMYTLKLADRNKTLSVKGTVVWCLLKETRRVDNEEVKPFYVVGMEFEAMPPDKLNEILAFIAENKKGELPVYAGNDKRRSVRFSVTTQSRATLHFPSNFRVKVISLSGMLILCDHALGMGAVIHMDIDLPAGWSAGFEGRVVFCREVTCKDREYYDIGIEFLPLSGESRGTLEKFIRYCETQERAAPAKDEKGLVEGEQESGSRAAPFSIKSYKKRIKG